MQEAVRDRSRQWGGSGLDGAIILTHKRKTQKKRTPCRRWPSRSQGRWSHSEPGRVLCVFVCVLWLFAGISEAGYASCVRPLHCAQLCATVRSHERLGAHAQQTIELPAGFMPAIIMLHHTLGLLGFSNCCRMKESGVLAAISCAFCTAPCQGWRRTACCKS